MSERVTMPALGESVTEGTVTRWLKNVGDRIEVDEPLLEVSTDKVDTEIPSPVAGTLQEILAQEDDTVPVGADLAVIGDGERPGLRWRGPGGRAQAGARAGPRAGGCPGARGTEHRAGAAGGDERARGRAGRAAAARPHPSSPGRRGPDGHDARSR